MSLHHHQGTIGHPQSVQSLPRRLPTSTHTYQHVTAATGLWLIYPQKCVVGYPDGRRRVAAIFWNLEKSWLQPLTVIQNRWVEERQHFSNGS